MKNILITGGTGFIGLNLIRKLFKTNINKNFKVYVLSRKKELYINEIDYEVLSKVKFIRGDICNFQTSIKFEEIYHLAYDTVINDNFLESSCKTIIDGLINIVKICQKSNAKRLVFLSSGAVYENLKKNGFKTDETLSFNLFNRDEHYGILKATAEHYLWSMFINKNTKISIYRVFAVIGPYMRLNANFILGNIIENLLNNKKNSFKTDCKVYRNIIYIDDLLNNILIHNSRNKFLVENVVGKNVNLRSFLINLSKKENFKISFGNKKNINRINYIPFIKKDVFDDNYLYDSFNKTFDWFNNRKNRKILIS